MKKSFTRIISVLLCIGMIFTMSSPGAWMTQAYAAETDSVWTEVEGTEEDTALKVAASSEKLIAITMTTSDGETFVLPSATTSSGPTAKPATITDGKLVIGGAKEDYGWTITAQEDGTYAIQNSSEDYLYLINNNNGVRVGDTQCFWTIAEDYDYLYAKDTGSNPRYMGVYTKTNWRAYKAMDNNIKDQTLQFWEFDKEQAGGEVQVVSIETALAASSGEFTVKGVVTLVDGSNVYIQDETGGICLYFATAPTDINLGDTLQGTGNRTTYNGLPELAQATAEKVTEGAMTLTAKETTIDALTSADLCTYVSIKNLTVTNITGNNTTLKDESGNTIVLFKGVSGGLAKDANIDFTGAVGIYSGNLQLRNTSATEITVNVPEGPFTVTIETSEHGTVTSDVELNETIPAGTEITFMVTPDEGYVLDKLLINDTETTVGEDGTVKVTITRDTTVSATFKEAGSTVTYDTIAEALAGADGTEFTVKGVVTMVDGKNIYVQDETGGICLYFSNAQDGIALGDTIVGTGTRATYNGLPELSGATYEKSEGMTLTAKETTIDALTNADICTYVSIKNLKVTAISGSEVTLTDENNKSIKLYKGVYDVLAVDDEIDFKGSVGIYKTTLQLRNTLNSEIKVKGDFEGLVTDLSELEDGSYVVIYNEANQFAMTSETYRDWYLLTGEAAIVEGKVQEPKANEIWKVTVNEDGTYTFTQDPGLAVAGWLSGTYLELTSNAAQSGADISWNLTNANAEKHTFYMQSKTLSTTNGPLYIEVYNKNVNSVSTPVFCTFATSSPTEDAYGMQFYVVPKPDTPTPTGYDFGLTSTLNTGDEVILYNSKNGMGMGNEIASNKITGVSLTPVEGVITTDNTKVVWTVTKNSDNTYTFTQGDNTLGGVVSGTKNNLVVTGATATNWTLTGPDTSDFNYFMYLGDMTSNYGKVYLEYYNGFTLYGSNTPDKDAFGITFYKKGADPETPSGGGEEGNLVTSLDQLTDGATVAIYSQTHGTAISTKPNGDWYLKANAATIEDGEVKNFTKDFIWTVKVNDDGTYSFYSYNEEANSISVWPSGTYAELTVNTT